MGILRADRITGLGGANAITGSVFLGGKQENSNFLPVMILIFLIMILH